jgi:hypothetical protein
MLPANWSLEYKAAHTEWDAAWQAIVRLKRKYHPHPVPLELRGDLETRVAAAADKLKRTPKHA